MTGILLADEIQRQRIEPEIALLLPRVMAFEAILGEEWCDRLLEIRGLRGAARADGDVQHRSEMDGARTGDHGLEGSDGTVSVEPPNIRTGFPMTIRLPTAALHDPG